VFGLVLRILHDRQLSEDVVQEVFTSIWKKAADFDSARSSPNTWLMTIAHNAAIDRLRRERKQPSSASREASNLAEAVRAYTHIASLRQSEIDDPVSSVIEADQRHRILSALARLPVEQQQTIELAYFGGLTQSEIAAHLNVPVGTVKSRIFNGMHYLREMLEESGVARDA
jgi:RNA polymerase sigma-70 factor (ECF subfamily)